MKLHLRKWGLVLLLACISTTASAQKNARYHVVEEGQTIYAIARLYSVSPNELMKLNPKAGDNIRPGDKIRIPDEAKAQVAAEGPGAQFVGSTGAQSLRSRCKQMYEIQKKDNLFRISQNFGITIQELVKANPGLTEESKLKKGEWLCIPYSAAELQAEANRQAAIAAASQAATKKQKKSHLNVAVILPLKENTDRGGKMIEFYQGILLAADSVRKQGTSVDLYAYHSGSSVADLNAILEKTELKHMDVIFGPIDGVQANILNTFSQQNKVRLVMPFATTNTYGTNNPYAYIASATNDNVARTGAGLIAQQFRGYNFIQLSCGASDAKAASFTGMLTQQLSAKGTQLTPLDVDYDDSAFLTALSMVKGNLIILNNTSQTALQKATRKLRSFAQQHPEYKISLLAYPEWSVYQGSIVQDFHALDTYAYAPFFRNANEARIQAFEQRFKANFRHELIKTSPRYGIMGMDLGYYFMHGLAQLGDFFDERQGSLTYAPFQNGFKFTQGNANSAHTNTHISLIHYTPAGTIHVTK